MRLKVVSLVLSLIAVVLTTQPSVAFAQEEKTEQASCTLSYVDVFCAKNPDKCRASSALASTSVHAEFTVVPPLSNIPVTQPTTVATSLPGAGLDAEVLFNLVNSYRVSRGLAPFEKHPDLCALGDSRGPELMGEISNGDIHGGLRRRNMPYWVTENMKYGGNEQEVLNWWLNSPIHSAAIHGSTKYACTHCSGPVCIMLFSDFVYKDGRTNVEVVVTPTVTPVVLPTVVPTTALPTGI